MVSSLYIARSNTIKEYQKELYEFIYTEKSTYKTLLKWCDFNKENNTWKGPLSIYIHSFSFFDKFSEDFLKLRKYIPEIKSLKDMFIIFSDKEDRCLYTNPFAPRGNSLLGRITPIDFNNMFDMY